MGFVVGEGSNNLRIIAPVGLINHDRPPLSGRFYDMISAPGRLNGRGLPCAN